MPDDLRVGAGHRSPGFQAVVLEHQEVTESAVVNEVPKSFTTCSEDTPNLVGVQVGQIRLGPRCIDHNFVDTHTVHLFEYAVPGGFGVPFDSENGELVRHNPHLPAWCVGGSITLPDGIDFSGLAPFISFGKG